MVMVWARGILWRFVAFLTAAHICCRFHDFASCIQVVASEMDPQPSQGGLWKSLSCCQIASNLRPGNPESRISESCYPAA